MSDSDAPNDSFIPPAGRLQRAKIQAAELDLEIQALENSGYARIGSFTRPLSVKIGSINEETKAEEGQASENTKEDVMSDKENPFVPFYQTFYDEEGKSLFENLLRTHMRILALCKLLYTKESLQYVKAQVDLAETYARMNLWKQTHSHMTSASDLLALLESSQLKQPVYNDFQESTRSKGFIHLRLLLYLYEAQIHEGGDMSVQRILSQVEIWRDNTLLETSDPLYGLFASSNELLKAFESIKVSFNEHIHWQKLLLHLHKSNEIFQHYQQQLEQSLPDLTRTVLRGLFFTLLDGGRTGIVSLQPFLTRLSGLVEKHPEDTYLTTLYGTLKTLMEKRKIDHVTWLEVLEHGRNRHLDDTTMSTLRPRIEVSLGIFALKHGKLEEAYRHLSMAIQQFEELDSSSSIVELRRQRLQAYLSMAQVQVNINEQKSLLAQQKANETAAKWLASAEGTRGIRSKAVDLIEQNAQNKGALMSNKEAEKKASEVLLQEKIKLFYVEVDLKYLKQALECCTKALEATDSTRDFTQVQVYTTFAQVHLAREEPEEAIRNYHQALEILQMQSISPASGFLYLDLAQLYTTLGQTDKVIETLEMASAHFYQAVTDHSLVTVDNHIEEIDEKRSDFVYASVRKDCTRYAIEALKQSIYLIESLPHAKSTKQIEKKGILLKRICMMAENGMGEFQLENAENLKALGRFYKDQNQLEEAKKNLYKACVLYETHFGTNDRRYRRLRKEIIAIQSNAEGGDASSPETSPRQWLHL
jgi:tetratricopeptide (TPR) repeat protein